MADAYELEFFAEDDGTKPVLAWIKNVSISLPGLKAGVSVTPARA